MEPSKTHVATLPLQELTQPVEGCLSGLRPADLMQGEQEGANPLVGQQVANYEAVDSATAGALHPPRVAATTLGESDGEPPHFSRHKIYQILVSHAKQYGPNFRPPDISLQERINVLIDTLGLSHNLKNNKSLKNVISKLTTIYEKYYKKAKYNKSLFITKHDKWLNECFSTEFCCRILNGQLSPDNDTFIIDQSVQHIPSEQETIHESDFDHNIEPSSSGLSSSGTCYETLGPRQKQRAQKHREQSLENKATDKAITVLANTVEVDGQRLLKDNQKDFELEITSYTVGPNRPSKVAKKVKTVQTPYTPEEALAIFIDRYFSVETYNTLQEDLKTRGFDVFPQYTQVRKARKKCYPLEPINVSEREASIPLFSLLSHTCERIIQLHDLTFSQYCQQKNLNTLNCLFEGSWGFDDNTVQYFYKQKSSDSQKDNNLIATTFIPLKIKTECGQVLWSNPTPQSYRHCRPIHIQYRKESKDLIMKEKKLIEDQIEELTTFVTKTSHGQTLNIKFKIYLTIIDGNVLNIITNTNSQLRCPFCKATSSDFNKLDIMFSRKTEESLIKYGISPSHAWIRVLEFLLHLAYKNPIKQWRVTQKSPESRIVDETKKKIKKEVKLKLGLLVDVDRANFGTTNDSNTAKSALSDENRALFADILKLQQWLLDDLYTILVVLSCGLPVNAEKFGNFCKLLATKYVNEYPWYPMTAMLHKILIHGKDIIKKSALPIGMLSEQASELIYKFSRYDPEHHASKSDCKKNMLDLFNSALESSDPFISDIGIKKSLQQLNRQMFPNQALQLLEPHQILRETSIDSDDKKINFIEDCANSMLTCEEM